MTAPLASARDRRLDLAFLLFAGAAVVDVLLVALGLTHIGSAVATARSRSGVDPATVGLYIGIGIGIVLAFELAQAVLLVAFGRLARRRVPWARWALLVLTVLALIGFSEGAYVLGLLRLLLAAAGTVLVFRGSASRSPH
ncbi:hypothetical protein [Amnibacterium sp.]|uniref:hypothetical protein n=1 Tax=Amnibacterium sp. TaxID=1872496 RepID=UPI00260F0009|nr:hypothetical protein [Amnibacterium sp.]MCU1474993.1 hypothetical protein [Amnibacterium sp.]